MKNAIDIFWFGHFLGCARTAPVLLSLSGNNVVSGYVSERVRVMRCERLSSFVYCDRNWQLVVGTSPVLSFLIRCFSVFIMLVKCNQLTQISVLLQIAKRRLVPLQSLYPSFSPSATVFPLAFYMPINGFNWCHTLTHTNDRTCTNKTQARQKQKCYSNNEITLRNEALLSVAPSHHTICERFHPVPLRICLCILQFAANTGTLLEAPDCPLQAKL